jgi:hypothetical protein
MKKPFPALLLILLVLVCGLGALTDSLAQLVANELLNRSYRERVNRDLFSSYPEAAAYFDGRSAGYAAVAAGELRPPHTAEFLRGVGDAFLLSAELVQRAEATGSTDPNLPH